jgi:immunity protein 26 of polymorphic toxin system
MGVNDVSLPAVALDEASSGLAEIAAEFAEELDGPLTLAEFLELLGWAAPSESEAIDGVFTQPFRFKVVLKGNKPYRNDVPSRVHDLDDHPFEEAREHNRVLVERMCAARDAPVTPQQFASAILQVLRTGRIILADVKPENIRKLSADVPKKRIAKPKPGDVLAIPAKNGAYRMAVVITRNKFGTALGLFQGTSAEGRLHAGLRRAPRKIPIYTSTDLIADGTWRIVGHDDSLLALFPSDPPIYHRANAWPGVDTGEFGAAETGDGTLRLIGPDEAREVGLQDGIYRHPVHHAAWLQKLLDIEADREATDRQRGADHQ